MHGATVKIENVCFPGLLNDVASYSLFVVSVIGLLWRIEVSYVKIFSWRPWCKLRNIHGCSIWADIRICEHELRIRFVHTQQSIKILQSKTRSKKRHTFNQARNRYMYSKLAEGWLSLFVFWSHPGSSFGRDTCWSIL